MEKFDWTSTIKINFWVLRLVGLWPEKNRLYEPNFYTFYAIFNAVVFIGLHNLSQIINIFFVYSDLEAVTGICFILVTNMLGTTKMYFFVKNLKEFKQLLVLLDSNDFQPKSLDQVALVQPSLRRWKVSYAIYMSVVGVNLALWVLAPLMRKGYDLPFLAWYPFSVEKSPNYLLMFLYQVISVSYITTANINLDAFACALLVYIRIQCDILCDDLCRLKGNHLEYNFKFVRCLKQHKRIFRFARQSNSLFDMLILGQFATSTFVLALTMFQLTLVDSVNEDAMVRFLYIIGISIQIFLYCWFGNEVELKSSQISYALYQSRWLDQPAYIKRNFLILSERCQKPIKITAINLFDLSLRTFISIIRSAWSYFAVLYNVNNR